MMLSGLAWEMIDRSIVRKAQIYKIPEIYAFDTKSFAFPRYNERHTSSFPNRYFSDEVKAGCDIPHFISHARWKRENHSLRLVFLLPQKTRTTVAHTPCLPYLKLSNFDTNPNINTSTIQPSSRGQSTRSSNLIPIPINQTNTPRKPPPPSGRLVS